MGKGKQVKNISRNWGLESHLGEDNYEGVPDFFDLSVLIDDDEPLFSRDSDIYYALKDLDFVDIQVTYPRLAVEDDLLDNDH